ncbi:thiol:disulfide interchange protein DsbA/DsbL [Pseudomonas sp. 460]|uniref:thiol:disulfide interchange protein DsbA/DsbL n=1 Tax=Pseudomonas sp. 460 TaxID=2485142 RepID=UPI0010EE47D2|nr:thiol:disulfide interchange protein DsbA/DsbL [Pseudomonas sp. 460]TCV51507.1 thiol:disulfide interchange protein DsbA [Pseudomonas sp. 460]
MQTQDARKVIVFFSFSCPVCATYDQVLTRWSQTMPAGWSAEFIPVAVPDKGNYMAARAFYAVQDADPARLPAFMSAAYAQIHEGGMEMENPQTWAKAVAAAKVQGFEKAWANVTQARLESAFAKLLTYGVDATPSLAIGGRYIITPDDVQGDNSLFLQLANGMVSKVIQNR